MERVSRDARKLLAEVDRNPVQTDRRLSKPASQMETNLMVERTISHRGRGACETSGVVGRLVEPEEVLASLNRKFDGRGCLPWLGSDGKPWSRQAGEGVGRGPGGPPHNLP